MRSMIRSRNPAEYETLLDGLREAGMKRTAGDHDQKIDSGAATADCLLKAMGRGPTGPRRS